MVNFNATIPAMVGSMHGTTVLAVRRNGKTAFAADGQVTLGETILKSTARKLRLLCEGDVLAGFAGGVADALTLFEHFENRLGKDPKALRRAAVALAKEWRSDRMLRRLEAVLIVANREEILLISGNGEVIEPDGDVIAIGSGGGYALSAARALIENTKLDAESIARKALAIAGDICIFTNQQIAVEVLK